MLSTVSIEDSVDATTADLRSILVSCQTVVVLLVDRMVAMQVTAAAPLSIRHSQFASNRVDPLANVPTAADLHLIPTIEQALSAR